jgi:hypothetical protein
MRVEQFVLPAAVIEIAIVNVAVLVDMVIEREFGLTEGLSVHNNVVRFQSHCLSPARTIAKFFLPPQTNAGLLAAFLSRLPRVSFAMTRQSDCPRRWCRLPLWVFAVGLFALSGCADVPQESSEPMPAQRVLLGMSRDALLSCADPPVIERRKDDEMLFVYYREAPQFEESFGGTKSSFPRVHHGCRASLTLQQDRVIGIRYQSEPRTINAERHCEEIFQGCVTQ